MGRASSGAYFNLHDIGWGLRKGLLFALGYTIIAVILYVIAGNERFAHQGITLGSTILIYCLGGSTAGIVVGAFRPLLRRKVTAMVVATVAAVPLVFAMIVLMEDKPWYYGDWIAVGVGAILFGVLGTQAIWGKP